MAQASRMWGRSVQLPHNAPGTTLVRVDFTEPRELTAYLFPWRDAAGAPLAGEFYRVTYGGGGTSNVERVSAGSLGVAYSIKAAALQVDTEPTNPAAPNGLQARAYAAEGLAVPFEQPIQVAASASATVEIPLPAFTTSVQLVTTANGTPTTVPATGRFAWASGMGTSGLRVSDMLAAGTGHIPINAATTSLFYTAGPEVGGTLVFLIARGMR